MSKILPLLNVDPLSPNLLEFTSLGNVNIGAFGLLDGGNGLVITDICLQPANYAAVAAAATLFGVCFSFFDGTNFFPFQSFNYRVGMDTAGPHALFNSITRSFGTGIVSPYLANSIYAQVKNFSNLSIFNMTVDITGFGY